MEKSSQAFETMDSGDANRPCRQGPRLPLSPLCGERARVRGLKTSRAASRPAPHPDLLPASGEKGRRRRGPPLLRRVGPRRRRGVVSVLLNALRLLAGLPGRFGELVHFLMLVIVGRPQGLVG